jgi:hypothetical protein
VTGVLFIALGVFLLNIAIAMAVANYGPSKGFPFAPVLIAALFIGFPLVLLAVALMPPRPGSIAEAAPVGRRQDC